MLNLASITFKDSYYGDYYNDDPHYRYGDDFEDSFDNDDVSSIVDTDRNLRRYPSQVRRTATALPRSGCRCSALSVLKCLEISSGDERFLFGC